VVSVKGWVARRGEEISARVTTDGVVNAALWANFHGVRNRFGEKTILVDAPFTPSEVSLPSNSGEFCGPDAYFGQSQYGY